MISESDLFKFVFHIDDLNIDKRQFIEDNFEKFSSKIEFLRRNKLFQNSPFLEDELDDAVGKILNKETSPRIFYLAKKEGSITVESESLKLAANSYKLHKNNVLDTYIDSKSNYIIKIIHSEDNSKIFLFDKENNVLENYTIELLPAGITFTCKDNKSPLVIDKDLIVEEVKLLLK
ncbi:MAG: hypothetical protein V1773_00905 [bacterium]